MAQKKKKKRVDLSKMKNVTDRILNRAEKISELRKPASKKKTPKKRSK